MVPSSVFIDIDTHLITLKSTSYTNEERLESIKKLRECLDLIQLTLQHQHDEEDRLEGPFLEFLGSLTSKTENWIVHARVVQKTEVKRWDMARTSGQLFHVVLEDSSGEMRCTIFDEAVEKFNEIFKIGQEYAISNGKIRKKQDYGFEMSLNTNSTVTPLNIKSPSNTTSPSTLKKKPILKKKPTPEDSPQSPTDPTNASPSPKVPLRTLSQEYFSEDSSSKGKSILRQVSLSEENQDQDALPARAYPSVSPRDGQALRSILKRREDASDDEEPDSRPRTPKALSLSEDADLDDEGTRGRGVDEGQRRGQLKTVSFSVTGEESQEVTVLQKKKSSKEVKFSVDTSPSPGRKLSGNNSSKSQSPVRKEVKFDDLVEKSPSGSSAILVSSQSEINTTPTKNIPNTNPDSSDKQPFTNLRKYFG
eukprot:TRINITY_DN14224_c0_g1_i1.p1 TRINITY_DN14224_c0_g1~~TRINITY_DN14224_c0_g1_i1.p1  ORF type:complete len:421 (+),score=112.95 TRINITY_DN14224_c0_g1_i1:42-1304(+)